MNASNGFLMNLIENGFPELEALITQGSVSGRVRALDYLTNLFLSSSDLFAEQQAEVLDDLFLRLSADIEEESRRVLAIRLADHRRAPAKTIAALAADDAISVAQPVLSRSDRLDDRTLVQIVTVKSQEYLLAVSTRQAISPAVTDVLVSRGDERVLLSTTRNGGARFSERGYENLVRRSAGFDELTQCVGTRSDIPRYLFLELVSKASEAVRQKFIFLQPHLADEISQMTAEVAGSLRTKPRPGVRNYDLANRSIDELRKSGRLDGDVLKQFADSGRFEEMVAMLAALARVPIEVVERAMMQERPELLIMIARAADVPWAAAKAVLSVRTSSVDEHDPPMRWALGTFEKLKPATAQQAVRFFLLRKNKSDA
jgi:uncharacterized protein (DUF2336 family)